MIARKSGLLCSSLTALQGLQCPVSSPSSSTSCRYPYLGHDRYTPNRRSTRFYASIADGRHAADVDELSFPWPDPIPPHKLPTPYQILGIKPNEAYSKNTFHHLVKTYHPDRTQHELLCPLQIRDVPQHIRLERYRLIIAAHAILSDPTKRTAYDRSGVGWAGHPSVDGTSARPEKRHWKPGEDPMRNATWEDWERWHNRDSKDAQSPLYISNGAFVSIVILIATVGAMAEAKRAKSWGNSFLVQRDMVHAEASKELRRARQAANAAETHHDRIEAFLRHKNSTTHAEEAYRRLLPKPEVCSSGGTTSPEK